MIKSAGSICSGIEAATVAFENLDFKWYSEIAKFPSALLKEKYPNVPNIGDMLNIVKKLKNGEIIAPDFICGGTPCQAFSLAGLKDGLDDERGNLTLEFVKIADMNDKMRKTEGLPASVIFWENVEGVLKDKTNAFGCLISSLAGFTETLENRKWPTAGLIRGPKRNIAWRILDAKYFGIPQQRKRVYLLAGGKNFYPEDILFEENNHSIGKLQHFPLKFEKNKVHYEVFREYTDTLYAAYGTKWNGNAAAYNGSLFVSENNKLRRLTPLECERLMGFPDNYTNISSYGKRSIRTQRYKALGNSWAVPVIRWIGRRLLHHTNTISKWITASNLAKPYLGINDDFTYNGKSINTSYIPQKIIQSSMKDIVAKKAPKKLYISPVGCAGILRRKKERHIVMNKHLENLMINTANKMSKEEIEKKSRKQHRGAFSLKFEALQKQTKKAKKDGNKQLKAQNCQKQLSLF